LLFLPPKSRGTAHVTKSVRLGLLKTTVAANFVCMCQEMWSRTRANVTSLCKRWSVLGRQRQ